MGETSIDFSDYVDAIKTCNVSLPLQNSISKALLHVSSLSLFLFLALMFVMRHLGFVKKLTRFLLLYILKDI